MEKDPSTRYQTASGVISDLKPLVSVTKSSISVVQAKPKKRWIATIVGVTLIAIVIVAGIKYWPESKENSPFSINEDRIMLAILPFENLGAPEDEYFADGITNEITSKVIILKDLGVIGRTSVLQYKRTKKRVSEIGNELNVDFILEGTIRWDKSGDVDKVRISPQLTSSGNNIPKFFVLVRVIPHLTGSTPLINLCGLS